MVVADFFNNTMSNINQWFAGEQSAQLPVDVLWWLLAVAAFLLGASVGYFRRAKNSSVHVENLPVLDTAPTSDSSFVYLQLLLAETKIVIERYQSELGERLENTAKDETPKLEAPINAKDLHIYYSMTDDLKKLDNSALRLQIVKANTLFKLTLNRFQYYRELHREFEHLSKISAQSQKPIDNNITAQARIQLQRELKVLRQDHLVMMTQMQQMFTMIRSNQQSIKQPLDIKVPAEV